MQKFLFFLFALIFSTIAMAQATQQYQRSDYTFKTTKVKDAKDYVTSIRLDIYAKGQQVDTRTYELPVPSANPTGIGEFKEADINFDGYPDIDIYLGYYGGFANSTIHEALLWDQQQRSFIRPKGYDEIGEPMLDTENKCITTVLSDGPDRRVTSYYRWEGQKLVEYLSHSWMVETDNTTDFSGLVNYRCHRINAKLDGRIPVNIVFQRDDDKLLAGYIYYPNALQPAPIMILGHVFNIEGKDYYYFSEYQPDGVITGHISLILNEGDFYSDKVEGTWTNPKTSKEFKLTELSWSHEMPDWFTESLLKPEDPGNIGVRYSFQEWDVYQESMAGGHISFRAAGKNKVHFECCNARHNIAEGRSDANRPAVLKGNTFEYHHVNECDYAFRATFYPRFVHLSSISEPPTLGCFGSGAAFDGIYIKVKQ